MKRLVLAVFLLSVACGVHAKPFYSYELYGAVTGDVDGIAYLADLDMTDEFIIHLNIWEKSGGKYKVSFYGAIGNWIFLEHQAFAHYYWGPERFYTWGDSALDAPRGVDSEIDPTGFFLTMLGIDETGGPLPEENWLIRNTGEINLNQFQSGSFYFSFINRTHGSSYSTEEDLYGSITRIVEVPEPGTLLLSVFGFAFLCIKRHLR